MRQGARTGGRRRRPCFWRCSARAQASTLPSNGPRARTHCLSPSAFGSTIALSWPLVSSSLPTLPGLLFPGPFRCVDHDPPPPKHPNPCRAPPRVPFSTAESPGATPAQTPRDRSLTSLGSSNHDALVSSLPIPAALPDVAGHHGLLRCAHKDYQTSIAAALAWNPHPTFVGRNHKCG